MAIPDNRMRDVVFEALRRDFGGQWVGLTQAVAWVATERAMTPPRFDTRIVQIEPADEPRVRALVTELLEEGVLTLGIPGGEAAWPWLSLTPRGREIVFRSDEPPSGLSARGRE